MANFVFNISKGRVAELYRRVDIADPAAATLGIAVFNISGGEASQDTALKDCLTMAAVEATSTVTEVTNTNYARKELAAADIGAYDALLDTTNDWLDLDLPDQTWTAVAAGDAWHKLVVFYCYDGNHTAANNANQVPLTAHAFAVTPDGSDITAQIDTEGFYRAS